MVAMMATVRRGARAAGKFESRENRTDGADVYRSQARKEVFRINQGSGGDAEPYRGSEGILRSIPAGEGTGRRPPRRGLAGRLQVGVSHLRLFQFLAARVRQIRIRAA